MQDDDNMRALEATAPYELGMALNVLFMRFFFEDVTMDVPWYLLATTGVAVFACWRTGWKRLWLWVYVYGVLTAQSLFTVMDVELETGYLLYATGPLLACSLLETVIIAVVSDPQVRAYIAWLDDTPFAGRAQTPMPLDQHPNRIVRFFVGLFRDPDVRDYYAMYVDVYLTLCACVLTFHGAGIFRARCYAIAYAPLVIAMYLATDRARCRRHLADMPLPAAAAKAVYVLYAPTAFWFNLLIVAAMNALVVEHPSTRRILLGGSVAMLVATIRFQPYLDTCI
jgi:hypothetical protein